MHRLRFDVCILVGAFSGDKNIKFISHVRELLQTIANTSPIHLIHVKGHLGNEYNEIADLLASIGDLGGLTQNFRVFEDITSINDTHQTWKETCAKAGKFHMKDVFRGSDNKPWVKQFAPNTKDIAPSLIKHVEYVSDKKQTRLLPAILHRTTEPTNRRSRCKIPNNY